MYMKDINNKFLENIKKYNLIKENDKVLVGLSGGADSVCLLNLLYENNLCKIGAVHINHGVRGEEADRDELFCENLCKKMGIDFYKRKVDMNFFAKDKKISKEEAGRILRKDIFNDISKEHGYSKIALAHNYNDQVETLLMRIFRGTGIDGLSGIEYKSDNIIRPLLNIKRSEIEKYILDNNLEYVDDSTNFENEYNRNKIRNIIIPTIEDTLNENISENIFNLSELAKIDSDYLDNITKKEFKNCCKINEYYIQLDIEKLKNLDDSIKYRLVRKVFEYLNGDTKNLSRVNVEDILNLSDLSSGREIENISGVNIRKSFDNLIFSKNLEVVKDFKIKLESGNTYTINGYNIEVFDSDLIIDNENSISISNNLINGDLVLRNRRDGDRILPQGRNSIKKLKDIFIENKIDKLDRDRYLIIADNEIVYWVYNLVKSSQLRENDKMYKVVRINKEN